MVIRCAVLRTTTGWREYREPCWTLGLPEDQLDAEKLRNLCNAVEQYTEEHRTEAVGFLTYEAARGWGLQTPGGITGGAAGGTSRLPAALFTAFHGIRDFPDTDEAQLPEVLSPQESCTCTPWTPLVDEEEYARAIQTIREHLAAGDTYQVNYTFPLTAEFSGSPRAFFRRIWEAQRGAYSAYLEVETRLDGSASREVTAVLSVSPELFLERHGTRVVSLPMKGTAARGHTPEEDCRLSDALRESPKERAENMMITDMIRNDLGRVAEPGSVAVPELFTVQRYPRVLQMVSRVEATTSASLAELLEATFPCASITGAPKIRTMEIISSLEREPRGIYTGAIGVIAPDRTVRLSVAIRTVVISGNAARFGVGSGIVWDSRAADEYNECRIKASILQGHAAEPFSLLETMRWNGADSVALWELHRQRLAHSAEFFLRDLPDFLRRPWREGARDTLPPPLQNRLDALVAQEPPAGNQGGNRGCNRDWRIRLLLQENQRWSVEGVPLDGPAVDILAAPESLEHLPARSVVLADQPVATDNPWVFHKTTERTIYQSFLQRHKEADDVILWNHQGEITESCTASVVLHREDGELVTPPVRCGLLAGVFRRHLLEHRNAWTPTGRAVREERVTVKEMEEVRHGRGALYLVNSVRGWMRAALLALVLMVPVHHGIPMERAEIPLRYWGDTSCPHCDVLHHRILPDLEDRFPVSFLPDRHNVLMPEERLRAEEELAALGLPFITSPVLFVGNNAYQGSYAIEEHLPREISFYLQEGYFRQFSLQASMTRRPLPGGSPGEPGVLRFFWGVGCPHCERAKPLIDQLERQYPALTVERYELFETREHHDLFRAHLAHAGVESTGVPQFFLGDHHWIGFSPAMGEQIAAAVAREMAAREMAAPREGPSPPREATAAPAALPGGLDPRSTPAALLTIAIAFVDGFNPCSLWVLTLLLGLIIHTRSRRRVLLVGSVFLVVTASIYGLFMVGLFTAFMAVGISLPLRWAVAVIAGTMGAINMKDYLAFRRGISLGIPEAFKSRIAAGTRMVHRSSESPGGTVVVTALFAAGIAIVELPCTAGFPVLWSQYVAAALPGRTAVFWMLLGLYLLVYLVIEIVIITVAAITLHRISLGERNARVIRLGGGAVMVSLGVHFLVNPDTANTLGGIFRILLTAAALALAVAVVHRVAHRSAPGISGSGAPRPSRAPRAPRKPRGPGGR